VQSKTLRSTSKDTVSSQRSSKQAFEKSSKQLVMSEKSDGLEMSYKICSDPLNDIYEDNSSSGSSPAAGEESGSRIGTTEKFVSQIGITRRIPRPKTAEPIFTSRLTLDKVNNMASNPRMQASGSRVLKDILQARSRAQSAGLTRHDDPESKVWGTLKKRICAIALSDPRARNPVNDVALQVRLGSSPEDVSITGHDAAFVRGQTNAANRSEIKSFSSTIGNPQAFMAQPRQKERESHVPTAEMKAQVKSAAAALGHPI